MSEDKKKEEEYDFSGGVSSNWMVGQLGRNYGRRIYPKPSMDNNVPRFVRTIPWPKK